MLEHIKMQRTHKGRTYRYPVTIERRGSRVWFIEADFKLKDEIKAMKGAKWHGMDDPPIRQWSIADCARNNFQLEYLSGGNPYAHYDKPLLDIEFERPLFEHQKTMARHVLTYNYLILAAEMGCISGDAIIHCHRAGRGFEITLRDLCYKFHGGTTYQSIVRNSNQDSHCKRKWDEDIDTYVRGFRGKCLGLAKVLDVVLQGKKAVKRITTATGKVLELTPDHEICINGKRYGDFKSLDTLEVGNTIMVSAPKGFVKPTIKVTQNPPSDFKSSSRFGTGRFIDKDGYVRVSGLCRNEYANGQANEHKLVMAETLNRKIQQGESIHHLNGQRWDNRPENLVLCVSHAEHMKYHEGMQENLYNGEKAPNHYFVFDPITEIVDAGETDVYDIKCEGPYHNFVANGVVVSNCGKSLAAIEVMERSGDRDWWWVGPKSAIESVKREFKKWECKVEPRLMTYQGLVKIMKEWKSGDPAPHGVIFDESSRLKGPTSQRTQAAMALADAIRSEWEYDGYVVLMSGSPSPKSPLDWWSQTEIACPGFIREGSPRAFSYRLGLYEKVKKVDGFYWDRITWLDDEKKCAKCGQLECDHDLEPSINEVAYLDERMKGLVLPFLKKDVLDLPDMIFRTIECKPSRAISRVSKTLIEIAPTAIQALTWTRELSDGFQYQQVKVGTKPCPVCKGAGGDCEGCEDGEVDDIQTETTVVPCPKDNIVKELLEEVEEQGRIVIFAGFKGSIDRVRELCLGQGWDVAQVDGRGWKVYGREGLKQGVDVLDHWASDVPRVAFVAHPQSGGMGLTLTESRMAVFFSNDFNPESRAQAMARIHRPGMDYNLGATIVDIDHLPTDKYIRSVLDDNRRLELLTLGEIPNE